MPTSAAINLVHAEIHLVVHLALSDVELSQGFVLEIVSTTFVGNALSSDLGKSQQIGAEAKNILDI